MSRVDPKSRGVLAPRAHFDLGDYPQAVQWRPDSKQLALASISGRMVVLRADNGQQVAECAGHAAGTQSIAWHPSGASLWSGGQDGRVLEWATTGGEPRSTHLLGKGWVDRMAWRPDGSLLAASCGKMLHWYDHGAGGWTQAEPHPATVADIGWSPGGTQLATLSYGGVWIWSPGAATSARHLNWKGSPLVLSWSPNATFIATGDQDASVHFWYVRTGKDSRMWGYPGKVKELAWEASGRWLATGGGPDVCVWDCSAPGPENREPILCQLGQAKVTALAWSREHSLLAAGYADGKVVFWQPTRSVRPLAQINGISPVVHLAWSPDETALAIAHANGAIAWM